jgi:hypothetical protein
MAVGRIVRFVLIVMAGLDPAIHVLLRHQRKTWMPATSAGMTDNIHKLLLRGRTEKRTMKKPTGRYSKGEIGRVRVVEDFLPSPDRLVPREGAGDYRLTNEQAEEVRRRRADPNARKLTLDEFRKRWAIRKPRGKG